MLELRKHLAAAKNWARNFLLRSALSPPKADTAPNTRSFMPETMRAGFLAQFVRIAEIASEAKSMVDELAGKGVDAIKGVLEAGVPAYPFNRMDVNLLRAVADEAHAKNLPVAVHTGKAADVNDAVTLGADSIEHGSFADEIPDSTPSTR